MKPDATIPALAPTSSPQRDAVLRAAARLFREKGYERTTVRALATAVGIQSGSLFHHFTGKEEMLLAVMEHGLVLSAAHAEREIARARTPIERLEALFRAYLTALLDEGHRDYMTVLLYDFRSLSPRSAQRVHKVRSRLEKRWQGVLDEALPEADRADARLMGQFVFGAMNWALQWFRGGGALDLDALASRFARLALATCGFRR